MPFTFKAILKHNPREDKTHAVLVRITKDRLKAYYTTGIYVLKGEWSKTGHINKKWIKSHRRAEKLNRAILHDLDGLEAFGLDNPTLTASGLSKAYKAHKEAVDLPDAGCFLAFMQKEIEREKATKSIRTAERLQSTLNKLEKYNGKGLPLPFPKMTVAYVRDFITHLEKIPNRPSTIFTDIAALRKYANIAMLEGLMAYTANPFHTVKVKKKTRKKQRLDTDTFEVFRTYKLTEKKLIDARNTFLASFYMHGARINDVLELKWKAVTKDRIRYTMDKTDKDKDIKLTPQLKEILDHYRPEDEPYPTFVFPYLKEKHLGLPEKQYLQAIEGATDRINQRLKDIAALAEIDINLSTHAARHTFADIARKKIKDPHTIKNLLNHASITTTEAYLSSFDQTDEDAATDSIYL